MSSNLLTIKNLTKKYKDGYVALDNVSFNLPSAGLIVITGHNGSGKSTLVSILAGYDRKFSGEILYDNKNIKKIKNYTFKNIGYISQKHSLIDKLNVGDNKKIFNRNNKDDFSSMVPDNKKIDEISGGQAKLVEIERVLNKNSSIILCDEIFGSLDDNNKKIVYSVLKEISKRKLVILVEHNIIFCKDDANVYIELEKGKIKKISYNNVQEISAEQVNSRGSKFNLTMIKYVLKVLKNNVINLIISLLLEIFLLIILMFCVQIVCKDTVELDIDNSIRNNKLFVELTNNDHAFKNYINLNQNFKFEISDKSFTQSSLFYFENIDYPLLSDMKSLKNLNVYGEKNLKDNEIVITETQFELFKKFGIILSDNSVIYPNNMADILNSEIDLNDESFVIKGVLLQDLSDYEVLKTKENVSNDRLGRLYSFYYDEIIKYNSIYMNEKMLTRLNSNLEDNISFFVINSKDAKEIIDDYNLQEDNFITVYSDLIYKYSGAITLVKVLCVILGFIASLLIIYFIYLYTKNCLIGEKNSIIFFAQYGLSKLDLLFIYSIDRIILYGPIICAVYYLMHYLCNLFNNLISQYLYFNFYLFNNINIYYYFICYFVFLMISFLFVYGFLVKCQKERE